MWDILITLNGDLVNIIQVDQNPQNIELHFDFYLKKGLA